MRSAQGPVLIGTTADPNNPKVGRVLGCRADQEDDPVHAGHQ